MSIEGTQQRGRTRWQEYVISKAYFLENERNRLCERECKSPETAIHVKAATTGHLKAARRAAGLTEAGDTDLRLARRQRLVDAWTGASVEGAFVNLHAGEVVLANLYSEEDINSRIPDVLARMRSCMPADDERRVKAEALFGAQANGAAPSPSAGATGTGTAGTRSSLALAGAAASPTRSPNGGPGSATPCGSPTTPPTSCTPGSVASATC
jgi:hypothetical protein